MAEPQAAEGFVVAGRGEERGRVFGFGVFEFAVFFERRVQLRRLEAADACIFEPGKLQTDFRSDDSSDQGCVCVCVYGRALANLRENKTIQARLSYFVWKFP